MESGHFRIIEIINDTEGTTGTTASALEAHSFTLKPRDFPGGAQPKVTTDNIGAATILLWEKTPAGWTQVFKNDLAVELDAANPQEAIQSYGTYALSKAAATTGISAFVVKVS